jgi:hypothetical protein
MRHRIGLVATLLFVAAGLRGQQPAPQSPPQPTPIPEAPNVVYQVDLEPTGTGFAIGKPVQEGDVWVMTTLPDRTVSRVPTAKVKKISRWSSDLNMESIWQIDLVPTGVMLSREEPVKKGALYTVKAFKGGTLASLREADVKKITHLTGMDAFKAQRIAEGAVLITTGPPPGPGGGTVRYAPGSGPPTSSAPGAPGPPELAGNWFYEGVPGASDAYAPGSATVARPGDTPMMPTPPPQPPR